MSCLLCLPAGVYSLRKGFKKEYNHAIARSDFNGHPTFSFTGSEWGAMSSPAKRLPSHNLFVRYDSHDISSRLSIPSFPPNSWAAPVELGEARSQFVHGTNPSTPTGFGGGGCAMCDGVWSVDKKPACGSTLLSLARVVVFLLF